MKFYNLSRLFSMAGYMPAHSFFMRLMSVGLSVCAILNLTLFKFSDKFF